METKNQDSSCLLDIYVRGHGLFRDIDLDDNTPSEMKRDKNKPFVCPKDLDDNTKLFFYGPSGYRLAGNFADSIILSQQQRSPDQKSAPKASSKLYHSTIGKDSMYVCWPNSSDIFQEANITYPHAIFTLSGWKGYSSFFYPNEASEQKVLNYDIGYGTKDLSNLNKPGDVWTTLIEVTRQQQNRNWTYQETARSITKNDRLSLYSVILHYQSRFTSRLSVKHELRIHWVSCRSYAQDNKLSPDEGYINAQNLTHQQYVMGSKHSTPNATQILNQHVAKIFGNN